MNFLSSIADLFFFVLRKHWLFEGTFDPVSTQIEDGCYGVPNQFGRQRHSGVAAARRQARKLRNRKQRGQ